MRKHEVHRSVREYLEHEEIFGPKTIVKETINETVEEVPEENSKRPNEALDVLKKILNKKEGGER